MVAFLSINPSHTAPETITPAGETALNPVE